MLLIHFVVKKRSCVANICSCKDGEKSMIHIMIKKKKLKTNKKHLYNVRMLILRYYIPPPPPPPKKKKMHPVGFSFFSGLDQ